MNKELSEGIRTLSQALNNYDVDYMFIGGIAIGFYGATRPSMNMPNGIDYDVDIWYLATHENFINLTKAIIDLSPELKDDLNKIVFDPKSVFLKFNLDNFHYDFLPELAAFHHYDFHKCYPNRQESEIDGVRIKIISKQDLIFNKVKLGRDQDLSDIENLKKHSYKGFSR